MSVFCMARNLTIGGWLLASGYWLANGQLPGANSLSLILKNKRHMQTGNIGVKTENIFPVIKKFLYSDQEIFLREIISNAVDATQKLKALAASGEFKGELGDLTIKVEVDKKKKTLTVRDRGIGMNAEEVDKYINQIAFSGAEEFIAKFKTQSEAEAANIIGHFGKYMNEIIIFAA